LASTNWGDLYKEKDVNAAYKLFSDQITKENIFKATWISRKRLKDEIWITPWIKENPADTKIICTKNGSRPNVKQIK